MNGRLYWIGADDGPIKIGWTARTDAKQRLRQIQTGNPEQLGIIGELPCDQQLETVTHARLDHCRVRGEWFERSAALEELEALRPFCPERPTARFRRRRPRKPKTPISPEEHEKRLNEVTQAFIDHEAKHGPIIGQRGDRT